MPVIGMSLLLLGAVRHAGLLGSQAVLFPNAPRDVSWRTYADYRWGTRPGGDAGYGKIPFWHEPTYDLDNGSHVVDYGADVPKGKGPASWPAQLSRRRRNSSWCWARSA